MLRKAVNATIVITGESGMGRKGREAAGVDRTYRSSSVRQLSALVRNALPRGAEAHFRFAELSRRWTEVAGPVLAPITFPVRVEDGCLVIAATTQAVAHRTMLDGRRICERAERSFGIALRGVRPFVGRIRPPRREARMQTSRPVTIPGDRDAFLRYREAFRGRIAEPSVADALASLAATLAARKGLRRR